MAKTKRPDETGKEFFDRLYQDDVTELAEWLRHGAAEKANSIELLLKRNHIAPRSMLELGCGTGALLRECRHRGLAEQYVGVDYSEEATRYLLETSDGIEAVTADITDPDASIEGSFDVVVLSHVLEHLEEPAQFLESALKKIACTHLVIEVPLEDLPASRVKALFRDRMKNEAGHVQFFTERSFSDLLESSGLSIVDKRLFVPIPNRDTLHFLWGDGKASKLQFMFRTLLGRHLPRLLYPVWKHMYYSHLACLCRISER